MEDLEIIDLYWSRDPSAITVSSEKYGRYCHKIAWNILRNQEDCEECINETWFRSWNAMPEARPDHLAAFFGAITRRLALDCYRKNRAAKRGGNSIPLIYDELQECLPDSGNESFSAGLPGSPSALANNHSHEQLSQNQVEQHLDAMALAEIINTFLDQLEPDSRVLFVRRYWYADSIREISYALHISESKVKSSLMRTRKRLKKHLEKEGIYV